MKNQCFLYFFILYLLMDLVLAFTQKATISIISILLLQISNGIFQPLQLELENRKVTKDKRATALSINTIFIDCIAIGINLIKDYLKKKFLFNK